MLDLMPILYLLHMKEIIPTSRRTNNCVHVGSCSTRWRTCRVHPGSRGLEVKHLLQSVKTPGVPYSSACIVHRGRP